MFTHANSLLLHAITPVHAGSGSEVGLVDLPIQRERQTGYPKIESSSLKGSVREYFESKYHEEQQDINALFGGKETSEDSQASAVSFSDARLLLFPVRSVKEVFVWITCPNVLQRFNREMATYYEKEETFLVPEANTISAENLIVSENKVVLEEYAYSVSYDDKTKQLSEQLAKLTNPYLVNEIEKRLVVLSDAEFSHFVELSTEVNARIKIDDSGTAENLWYEENVPAESIFYATVFNGQVRMLPNEKNENSLQSAEDVENYLLEKFPNAFQIGGNHTLGRGLMKTIWMK